MTERLRFDDSLPRFVEIIVNTIGNDAFEHGRAVRDLYGRLGYVAGKELGEKVATRLRKQLLKGLGPYASEGLAVLEPKDFGAHALLRAPAIWRLVELNDSNPIWLNVVDQRIVGQDWLAPPVDEPEPMPPRLVFASMKGGVGRSTALCVLAIHMAQQGRSILLIDADLEAPGLGALLLSPEQRPEFGLLDYLVDNGIGGWQQSELELFVASSLLSDRSKGQGLVDIVPVIGRRTLKHPEDMLSKLSRSMLEQPTKKGEPKSLRKQLREFVDSMSMQRTYDVVMVDTRAGFSEVAAGALLGLGAKVLFFGTNQLQTFEDYRFLLAHLARLSRHENMRHDWRRRLRFVHSKADPKGNDLESFKDRLYEVISEEFYEDEDQTKEAFIFSAADPQALHSPMVINFDFPFMRFDPVANPGQLNRETYEAAFGGFIKDVEELLEIETN